MDNAEIKTAVKAKQRTLLGAIVPQTEPITDANKASVDEKEHGSVAMKRKQVVKKKGNDSDCIIGKGKSIEEGKVISTRRQVRVPRGTDPESTDKSSADSDGDESDSDSEPLLKPAVKTRSRKAKPELDGTIQYDKAAGLVSPKSHTALDDDSISNIYASLPKASFFMTPAERSAKKILEKEMQRKEQVFMTTIECVK